MQNSIEILMSHSTYPADHRSNSPALYQEGLPRMIRSGLPAEAKRNTLTRLSFYGAAGTVTGSKFLLEHNGFRMLIDCGLFQGLKNLRQRNRAKPPFEPAKLDLVILTHAHLDHTGYLPVLGPGSRAARSRPRSTSFTEIRTPAWRWRAT